MGDFKKAYRLCYMHKKVIIWHLDGKGSARMVEEYSTPLGLTLVERAILVQERLLVAGFEVDLGTLLNRKSAFVYGAGR